ncbi:4-fold beta flower protein [Sandaracinobacteroides hominis]|uniref:4-fold beta flower protein n=1 Tax=Sandaracinobacteroides hominis TaxID=2780086 RepID=UPI0018F529A1|nr:hypothetical protein [Sandaracinobacteroides hominis]
MAIVYGQRGQPVASIVGDALFDAAGEQIALVNDNILYRLSDGQPMGSLCNGVVFDPHGAPHGFLANCSKGFQRSMPRLGILPPRLKRIGSDVSAHPSITVPDFLTERLPAGSSNDSRDGFFL